MKIPLEFYEFLRNRINISDVVRQKVTLARKSGNYVGLCPFHQEKTPSFTVNDNKRFYYCFGCAASGDVIKFSSNIHGFTYNEAAIKLANDYGIEIPKLTPEQKKLSEESDEILAVLELANNFFKSQFTTDVQNYLNARNINKNITQEFSLGFAPKGNGLIEFLKKQNISETLLTKAGLVKKTENGKIYQIFNDRITFPIKNIYNKIVGFGGRVLNEELPKYLNSPETILFQKSEILYGEHKAISSRYKKNYSILVEGYFDVIALHQADFSEAVASLGTSITENHLQKLWRAGDEIILCLDGDEAGIKASRRVINLVLPLINSEKKISFARLPAGSDPDDIINKNGPAFFTKLIENRMSLSEIIWFTEYSGGSFKTAEDKAVLEKKLKDYCNKIIDHNLKTNYQRFFKEQIWKNLISYKTKITKKNLPIMPTTPSYSESEMLEYAFCSVLVKFPDMLENTEVRDFLSNLTLNNKLIEKFRDWYFAKIIDNSIPSKEIAAIVEKTSFIEIFLLLSRTDNLFIGMPINKNNIPLDLFWQWLQKKYYLVNLKNEYVSIIQTMNMNDHSFEKVLLYQKEIQEISNELQNLNDFFIN